MLGRNAYRSILEFIREGIYAPGDRLREEEVAERLGVSRTPVREALGRLQEKGLLQPAPGRGLAIATLDVEQVFELYAMRGELEALVARLAAQHATAAELSNLEQLNAQFASAAMPKEAARVNRAFHARLYSAARNRYLRAAVEDLQETIALLPRTTFERARRTQAAAEEHAALLAAISVRDADASAEAARRHIAGALATRLEMIRDNDAAP